MSNRGGGNGGDVDEYSVDNGDGNNTTAPGMAYSIVKRM